MGNRKNKRKLEVRSNVSYKAAKESKCVHKVVYEWLKNTRVTNNKLKFKLLDDWRQGIIFLMIDFTNLTTRIKKPEYDIFLKKYIAKYLGVK
jgi:hypothetical protein